MKICITAQGKTLESPVDPRFGRCAYFIVIDPDTNEFEVVDNSSAGAAGGAGIGAGQLAAEKGVTAVLTGNVGPNAFKALQAAGIDIITGVSGCVKEAVTQYNSGQFKLTMKPSVESHTGMSSDK